MNEPRDPVDRLLKAELRATGADALPPATSDCVDAETFAAWAEGTLPPQQVGAIELHLADCSRCQALMAAFALTEPAVAAVAAPTRQPWFHRWAMPLAAAAAVTTIAVWLTRSTTPTTPVAPSASTLAENDAKKLEPATRAPAPAQGQSGRLEDRSSTSARDRADRAAMSQLTKNDKDQKVKEETAKRTQANEAKTRADAKPAAPTLPVAGATSAPPRQVPLPAPTPPPTPAVATPPPPPPATAAPPTRPDFSRAVAGNPTFRNSTGADEVAAAGPIVFEFSSNAFLEQQAAQSGVAGGVAARGGAGGGGGRGGGGARNANVAGATDAAAATPRRWRVYASGGVGRSTDGAIWERVQIDPFAQITAGVAPSPLVCWLVGRDGAVFISTDASRFTKLVFPDAVDLTSVRATNAREATVTTADGRTFVTTDGGITWTVR